MLIAGALLTAANPSGYYGLAAAVIGVYVVAILNAWGPPSRNPPLAQPPGPARKPNPR